MAFGLDDVAAEAMAESAKEMVKEASKELAEDSALTQKDFADLSSEFDPESFSLDNENTKDSSSLNLENSQDSDDIENHSEKDFKDDRINLSDEFSPTVFDESIPIGDSSEPMDLGEINKTNSFEDEFSPDKFDKIDGSKELDDSGNINSSVDANNYADDINIADTEEKDREVTNEKENSEDQVERIPTRNEKLEGQEHPDTGVPYERKTVETDTGKKVEGVFPQFESVFDAQLPEDLEKATDREQFSECNRQLKDRYDNDPEFRNQFDERQRDDIENGRTPYGYTWHHNEEKGKMQLVDYDTHAGSGHTGGRSIWGGGTENR